MLTVGEILKKERIKKGINLLEIEKKTKIREKYLKAIEENNWKYFSSKVYIIGVIKNYAKVLRLNTDKILALFRKDYEKKENIFFKKRLSIDFLNPSTKKIVKIITVFLIIFFLGYFVYQLKLYFLPPKIELISPKTVSFKKDEKITIVAKTDKDAIIYVFGQRIYQNKEGFFEYVLPLKKGENQLIIEAIGANGKKTVLKKILFRK